MKQLKLFALLSLLGLTASAQLHPLGGQYFQNKYLANPAMAGMDGGLVLNAGYRYQWNNIPGAPVTQSVTAEYRFARRSAAGLNFYSDEAGLIRRRRVMGSYAYHLQLDEARTLHFGLSFGFLTDRIDLSGVKGDDGDVTLGRFNDRDTYLDGDFGIAYTQGPFTFQAAVPNIKGAIGRDITSAAIDRSTFMATLAYRFTTGLDLNRVDLEPKLVYRGVHGYHNLLDAGGQATFGGQVALSALYHSTGSATFGLGIDYRSVFRINGMYTTETRHLSGYTNGDFEISLTYRIREMAGVRKQDVGN